MSNDPTAGRAPGLPSEPLAWCDGVPFSDRYGDVYASRAGALAQARQVFLGGNGLPARWAGRDQFVLLETGFGLGTNFLATWQAWRDDPARPARLHFVSVEAHPLKADDLVAAAPEALAPLARALAAQWPLPLFGLHRLQFEQGAVELTLALGDAQQLLPQLVLGADAIYLDGFAPDRNPAMWSAPLLKCVARLARRGATLATWCTARAVRDALAAAGFELALRPGFAHKRQLLTGVYAPRFVVRRHEPPAAYRGERHALVIGAGMAGCSAALALARRGWSVDLLEAGGGPAAAASGLPAGLVHAQLAGDDSRLARLTRAGLFATRRQIASLPDAARFARLEGLFQQADSEDMWTQWRHAIARQALPVGFVEPIDADEAARRLGLAPHRGGLWWPGAGVLAGPGWCQSMVESAGARLRLHAGTAVTRVERIDSGWCAIDAQDVRHAAPVIVHAAAMASPALATLAHAPLRAVRGRLSLLAAGDLRSLRAPLTGDGYAMHAPDSGQPLCGASYELALPGSTASADIDDALIHAGNLARLDRLLQRAPAVRRAAMFDQQRAVAPDRLPYAGAIADEAAADAARAELRGAHLADLPRSDGAFALFGLGSRGMTLAPLLAELLLAQLTGTPWPIERDLAASVDPARLLLQRLRRGVGA